MPEPWHTLSAAEALGRLGVEREPGLSEDEAARRLSEHGPNELAREEGPRPWRILWRQVAEPLVLVLVAAAAVSAALWYFGAGSGDREPAPYDALVILAIVVLNALLGFAQEYRAERAVEALRRMTAPASRVRRGGEAREVPTAEVVPGDVLLLEGGDRVAADARLLHSASLKVDESALTGESVPVAKQVRRLEDPELEPADRSNVVFAGTVATYGRGEAVVVATGMETEMGAIAGLLQTTGDDQTPLQRDLDRVGKQLGLLVLAICAVVAAAGVLREGTWSLRILVDMFLFGVALAVAAIPEGLPAVVTAVLALGVRRMADRNAIVRRLPAVETLGSATVICSDKTGTLTRNRMTLREVVLGDGTRVDPGAEKGGSREAGEALRRFLTLAILNNDAELDDRPAEDGKPEVQGDPTEGAFLLAARDVGLDVAAIRRDHPRRGEVPFSSERKRMTTLHELDGAATAVVKGAPEVLLERCDRVRTPDGDVRELDDAARRRILAAEEDLAGQARRTLAVATRALDGGLPASVDEEPGEPEEPDPESVERGLVWEGLAGLLDPPRQGAADSVARARRAGIRTILITGDHLATGVAVAREVGIATQEAQGLTGRDLARLGDRELARTVRETDVFARVRPEDKVRIVRALREQGEVVAMTGDGVNDAPALKEADIGVAMGIAGTDVAREAGDMVLADDDYSTIVGAVGEGRKIFDNLRKFVRYLLSSNAGEVLTMFAGILAAGLLGLSDPAAGGVFLPLTAVQILWINLVTDGAPALALGVDPGDPGLMDRPPRGPGESVIDRATWTMISVVGVVMMAGTLFVLDAYLPGGLSEAMAEAGGGAAGDAVARARTAAFTTLVLFQMANVFNCLSPTRSLVSVSPLRNRWLLGAVALSVALHAAVVYWPPLRRAFGTTPLAPADWGVAAAVAGTVILAAEAVKALHRRRT